MSILLQITEKRMGLLQMEKGKRERQGKYERLDVIGVNEGTELCIYFGPSYCSPRSNNGRTIDGCYEPQTTEFGVKLLYCRCNMKEEKQQFQEKTVRPHCN